MNDNYFQRRLKSFRHAFNGLGIALTEEPHAILHSVATLVVISAAIFLRCSPIEWAMLGISIGAVWCAELLNSSIERMSNKVSPEYDELIGQVKDLAAAAVLVMSAGATVAGLAIFLPKIVSLLS